MIKIFRFFPLFLIYFILNIGSMTAEIKVEVRSGAFIPTKERFRDVYGQYRSFFGVEASTPVCPSFDLWIGFDQFNKNSHINGCGRSKIELATFSVGLKKTYCLHSHLTGYLGIGLSAANVVVKNWMDQLSTHSRKQSWGGVLKSGFYIYATDRLFFDIFADYYYQPVHYHKTTDCGGFRLGVGLGLLLF